MLLWWDGFDAYITGATLAGLGLYDWVPATNFGTTFANPVTGGRNSGKYCSDPNALGKNVANTQELIVGGAFRNGNSNAVGGVIQLYDTTSNLQVGLNIDSGGHLYFDRNGTNIGSASSQNIYSGPTSLNGTWRYIEIRVKIHGSTGTIEARVDGITWVTATGLNTQATANAFANHVRFNSLNLDDMYVADTTGSFGNNFLGDIRVTALLPSSNGTVVWTPTGGGGVNFSAINETSPDDDTSYVASANIGDDDSYNLADLPGTATLVYGVSALWRARKDDVGTRIVRGEVTSGGTLVDTGDIGLTTTYGNYFMAMTTDPNTTAQWTVSNVNALKMGHKVTG